MQGGTILLWGPIKPNVSFPVQQNVQITYTLYKAVTNIIS
jgi:hypothetical protein